MAQNAISILIDAKDNASKVIHDVGEELKNSSAKGTTALDTLSTKSAAVMGIVAGAAQSLVNNGLNLITSSISDAVSRVDTLNRFPTVMQNLGYSAADAKSEVQRMASSLQGLPTSLDSLTTFVNRVAPVSGSLKGATDTALAFNNAVLAGGGPIYRQADAIEQFSQMLSKGKPDMMAWRTLQEAMPATLSQVAKGLGDTSGNTQTLYDKLQTGAISFQQFNDEVIKLNTKGLPGFKNFADQAKDATGGISTGVMNMHNAITRGIAAILTAIGTANISNAISKVGKAFETALKDAAKAITSIVNAIKDANKYYQDHKRAINDITAVIAPFVAALATIKIIFVIWDAFKQLQIMLTIMRLVTLPSLIASIQATWAILMANPIILVVSLIAAAAVLIITHWSTVKAFLQRSWSDIRQWGVDAWQAIVGVWQGASNWFGNIFKGIGSWASQICNDVVNFFSELPGRIVRAIGNIGGRIAGDIKGAFHSLHIPGFATGVRNFSGGMAIVGENGPELVGLPAGSSVYTNSESKNMLQGGGTTIYQTNHIYNNVDMEAANRELGWKLAHA